MLWMLGAFALYFYVKYESISCSAVQQCSFCLSVLAKREKNDVSI